MSTKRDGGDPPAEALDGPLSATRWRLGVETIGEAGRSLDLAADAAERRAMAEALGLIVLDEFVLGGDVRPLSRSRFRLKGRLAARYRQACVVTLEPLDFAFDQPVTVEFRPAGDMPQASDEQDLLAEDEEIEPIEAGALDLGRVAYELFAVTIDPYPRKNDAVLEQQSAGQEPEKPFAALAKLKSRQPKDRES